MSAGGGEHPNYDVIGLGYRNVRRPDPRIRRRLLGALGGAARVVNVGAGTGSYEPADRLVVAVEPSVEMIGQRPPGSAPVLRAVAERLPFADGTFDGALAVLTVHHWPDPLAGLAELARVTAGPVVVLTFDWAAHMEQWLVTDYLPGDGRPRRRHARARQDRRSARRRCDRGPPGPARLRRRLLPCVVAAPGGVPRSRGARRHLRHRPAAPPGRGPGHGPAGRGPGQRCLAPRPWGPALPGRRSTPATGSWWRLRATDQPVTRERRNRRDVARSSVPSSTSRVIRRMLRRSTKPRPGEEDLLASIRASTNRASMVIRTTRPGPRGH